MEKIGNIYDKKTTEKFYEAVGENTEDIKQNDAEKMLNSLIPQDLKGKSVLDIGCGNGRHSEIFCKSKAAKVISIDLSEPMIEQARKRKQEKQLEQLELIVADMDNLPIKQAEFDFIFSRFSLVHTGQLALVVDQLGKALRDDGEILIATNIVSIEKTDPPIDIRGKAIPIIININGRQVALKDFAYTLDEYSEALNKAGLKIENIEQFPAENLIIDPEFPNGSAIKFSYGIFKAKK